MPATNTKTTTPALATETKTTRALLLHADREAATALGAYLIGDEIDVTIGQTARQAASHLRAMTQSVELVLVHGSQLRDLDALQEAGLIAKSCPAIALCDGDAQDRTRALRRGCADAMTNPVDAAELVERIRIAGTVANDDAPVLTIDGGLTINRASRRVTVHGQEVELSKKQYDLLAALAADPQRCFRRDELLRTVWGYPEGATGRTLDSHVGRLRVALTEAGGDYIRTHWGVGYSLTR